VICVVSKGRWVLEARRFYCVETERMREWFAGRGPSELVVEATASYEWFVQLVEPHAERLVLAHPGKLRARVRGCPSASGPRNMPKMARTLTPVTAEMGTATDAAGDGNVRKPLEPDP
jgi:hypothetical protein